jgi:hypothetical protein
MPSVLNPWVQELTFMQQTVLLCAVRNHDGFNKHNPAKDVTRYLRRVVLCSAFDGRMLADPHEGGGGNFTGPLKHKSVYDAVTAFLDGRDEMTLHYWLHAVHAFEIVGYMCPDKEIARHFFDAYHRCVSAMHMEPESKYAMEQRLSDNPEKWLARSDAYERAAFHAEQVATGPSDGEIYAAVLQRMSDKTTVIDGKDTKLGEYVMDAELARLAPGQGDQGYPDVTTGPVIKRGVPMPPDDAPVPSFAAVDDEGAFVNRVSGLSLGHQFELTWLDRKAEFPKYGEDSPQPTKRERDNLGASDYDG